MRESQYLEIKKGNRKKYILHFSLEIYSNTSLEVGE
jgi:hypothetical protein